MNDRMWRFAAIGLLLAVLVAGLAWQLALSPTHEERDIEQSRFDRASLALTPGQTLGQTFACTHKGLKAIEIMLVAYDPERELPATGTLTLRLERLDRPSAPIEVSHSVHDLQHNQIVRFAFPPQRDSEGGSYRLTLSCDGDYGLGAWQTDSDAYAGGELLADGQAQPGDLRFATFYDYTLGDTLADLWSLTARWARYLPALLIALGLPGYALALWLLPRRRLDPWIYAGLVVALSLTAWTLAVQWAAVLNLSLRGSGAWVFMALWVVVGLAALKWRAGRPAPAGPRQRVSLADVALGCVLLFTAATRLLQVRSLVVPNWVDSVHHTLMTQLIVDNGHLPASYAPYLPIGDFHYHFGFHAAAAALTWLSGLATPDAVLLMGQAINVLAPLAVYALTIWLTGRRWAGVAGATVVGTLCYMPAYYVSWGRYTQLAGLDLLCFAGLVSLWALARERSRRLLAVAGLLSAGLALTHYRVLVFYALFWLIAIGLTLWQERASRGNWKRVASTTLAVSAIALLCSLPMVLRMAVRVLPNVGTIYGGWEADATANVAPVSLLKTGFTPLLLGIAGGGLLWAALRRHTSMMAFGLWCGLCVFSAYLDLVGLPDSWLISKSAMLIAFWLPLGVLCGWLVGDLTAVLAGWLARLWGRTPWKMLRRVFLAGACLLLTAWGGWHMVDTVNPITVLATADDLRAIRWIAENTPSDARFLINARIWTAGIWMGEDAGWWLPVLANRQVSMPCVQYTIGSREYVESIEKLARSVEEAPSLDDPALLELLVRDGITHVYVGAHGGRLKPAELDASPHYRLLYSDGPVRVYQFIPDPG